MRAVLSILFTVSLAACASSGAVSRPVPPPGEGASFGQSGAPPLSGPRAGSALAETAMSLRGVPYRNGGTDPAGFDCSGFVQYVFAQNGRSLPREVREQSRAGKRIARGRLAPGDLVFFSTVSSGASHVGIVVASDRFVHAPSERGVVRIEQMSSRYWASRFVGARRLR